MLRTRSTALASLAITLLVGACSSEATTSSGVDEPGSPEARFFSSYCAAVTPCCDDAQVRTYAPGYDPAKCSSLHATRAHAGPGAFDEARADRCLKTLETTSSCSWAPYGETFTYACKDLYARQGAAAGGACSKDDDCATDPRGVVVCAADKRCAVTTGTGSGECIGAIFRGVAVVSLGGTVGTLCNGDAEQYCHRPSGRCAQASPSGARCDENELCTRGTYCEAASSTCVATKTDGAACSVWSECTSSDCTNGVCGGGGPGDPGSAVFIPPWCAAQ